MAAEAHALLGASSASRWLNCPPSARLTENLPEKTSDYAEEGRLAHSIGELKLRKQFTEPMGTRAFNAQMKKLRSAEHYSAEMQGYTDAYVEYARECAMRYGSAPFVAVERRLDYSRYVNGGFGTGDCVMVGGGQLHIIDLKYGKGVLVSAQNNPQIMLYALGAIEEYAMFYDIDSVVMHIFQPRVGNTSEFEMTAAELREWGESIKSTAQMAFDGGGEYSAGEWCRFCKAKATCRARGDKNLASDDFKLALPPFISNDEVGAALTRAAGIIAWYKDLEEYAQKTLLGGGDIAGYKLVEGRRIRKFVDIGAALSAIEASGVSRELLYETLPRSLTNIEKDIGKKAFAEAAQEYIVLTAGKPTLVPESDKREKYNSAENDFKNIKI